MGVGVGRGVFVEEEIISSFIIIQYLSLISLSKLIGLLWTYSPLLYSPLLSLRAPLWLQEWDFNGADMDQGLLTHYFVLNHGNVVLVDTDLRTAKRYAVGLMRAPAVDVPIAQALRSCEGAVPTTFFAHFTGQQKPWMLDEPLSKLQPSRKNADYITWAKHLDALKLPVNSDTVASLKLGSPLGFWNHKFPKGGFRTAKGTEENEK